MVLSQLNIFLNSCHLLSTPCDFSLCN
jgi:hypothetical protein